MESVVPGTVLRTILEEEYWKRGESAVLRDVNQEDLLDDLSSKTPRIADIIQERQPDWYRAKVTESEFRQLRHVRDTAGLTPWPKLSGTTAGRIMTVAERISERKVSGEGVQNTVAHITHISKQLPSSEVMGHLVLLTPEQREGYRWVLDGNHRAAAKALHLLDDGEYTPQSVYLGRY